MKYCGNCVNYLFKNNKHLCKAFGVINFNESTNKKNINQHIKYYDIEYTRNHPQLCSMNSTFHIDKEEYNLLNLFNSFLKRRRNKR